MSIYLDTETKALLRQMPPTKYAPPDTDTFTLVLLEKGKNTDRVIQSLAKVPSISYDKAAEIVSRRCPFSVAAGLSIADALLGQFELICCDSISIFLSDEVVSSAAWDYLLGLYSRVRSSSEFEEIMVSIDSIPNTNQGRQLLDQFCSGIEKVSFDVETGYYVSGVMMRKKARILSHWTGKIGAKVTISGEKSGK